MITFIATNQQAIWIKSSMLMTANCKIIATFKWQSTLNLFTIPKIINFSSVWKQTSEQNKKMDKSCDHNIIILLLQSMLLINPFTLHLHLSSFKICHSICMFTQV